MEKLRTKCWECDGEGRLSGIGKCCSRCNGDGTIWLTKDKIIQYKAEGKIKDADVLRTKFNMHKV